MASTMTDRAYEILKAHGYEVADYATADSTGKYLLSLAFDIASSEGQVRDEAARVARIVTDAAEFIETGRTLNSLGVLQQYGPMFDTAVARLAEKRIALAGAVRHAKELAAEAE